MCHTGTGHVTLAACWPSPCHVCPLTQLSPPTDSSGKQTLQVPGARAAAPRPPVPASNSRPQDDADSSRGSPPELPRTQRPSLPDLSRPTTAGGTGMKHSSSAPPPPPPGRRSAAPPAPPPAHGGAKVTSYNREKPLPPTPGQRLPGGRDGPPAPPPIKPPPSPVSIRTGSGAQGQSLAPPPPPYRQPPAVPNGPSSPSNESAPELPQRHNSLHRKTPGPLRGLAPPPPTSASPSLQSSRPPPPARDPPSRGAGENPSLCWASVAALLGQEAATCPRAAGGRCQGKSQRRGTARLCPHVAVSAGVEPEAVAGLSPPGLSPPIVSQLLAAPCPAPFTPDGAGRLLCPGVGGDNIVEPELWTLRLLPKCYRGGDKSSGRARRAQPLSTILPLSGLVLVLLGSQCRWPRGLCAHPCGTLVSDTLWGGWLGGSRSLFPPRTGREPVPAAGSGGGCAPVPLPALLGSRPQLPPGALPSRSVLPALPESFL